ncbi:unnamed protein product [Gongylonema pulchrum]|uniref:Ion_trans domain-containing protein n=1 Tax=Gongylonema pulchrum TaxID=637853 RepID=A0A183E1H9_9BILA|nr:unnamed protein product [Gongylonema pulchrum]
MDALAGSVYINVVILGAARWVINIIASVLDYSIKSIGRRLLHLVSAGFIVVIMAIIFVIYVFTCALSIFTPNWPKINAYKAEIEAGGTDFLLVLAAPLEQFFRTPPFLEESECEEDLDLKFLLNFNC